MLATGIDPIEEPRRLDAVKIPKAIAGGIRFDTFEAACQNPAEIIISGGGIYNQPDIRQSAKSMRKILDEYNKHS